MKRLIILALCTIVCTSYAADNSQAKFEQFSSDIAKKISMIIFLANTLPANAREAYKQEKFAKLGLNNVTTGNHLPMNPLDADGFKLAYFGESSKPLPEQASNSKK